MKKIRMFAIMLATILAFGTIIGCTPNQNAENKTDGNNEPAGDNPNTDPPDPDSDPIPTGSEGDADEEKPEALDKTKTYNILFIGNSYTYYNEMPENIFAVIARTAGYSVNVVSITKGGHYLYEHANPNDEKGAEVSAKLANKKWDYVILQEQSTCAIDDPARFYGAVRNLVVRIRENGATPVLYETWGRKKGHTYLTDNGLTNKTMTLKLAAAYEAIGRELDVDVAYAGLAFYDIYSNRDMSDIELYNNDRTHPSATGSYLAALTIFAKIFGSDLTDVKYSDPQLKNYESALRAAAKKAAFEDPEIPEEYKTSSEGVEINKYGVDDSQAVNLVAFPKSPLISVLTGGIYPNGKTFSGILGTAGKIASTEYSLTGLTNAQKADIADIRNGVSVIGIEKMTDGKGYQTAIENLVNGHWGTSFMACFEFDSNKYDINGNVKADGKYTGLITINFGSKYKFDAMGFFSGSLQGFPGVAEVYVSDDGVNWKLVPTACWNNVSGTPLVNTGKTPVDPWNGNTTDYSSLFDMGGVTGQYIRIGVIVGRNDTADKYNTINTREIAVYGTKVEE